VKAQDALIQQANQTIAESEKQRAQAIADLEAARSKPATIQTVTKYLPAPLPQGSEVKIEQLPDAPKPQLVVTGDAQQNLQAIQNMELLHAECDRNLLGCRQVEAQKDNVIAAVTKQRDEWQKLSKGGSRWHRLGRALKVVGCAGGGAALGAIWKVKGAAIGG